MGLSPLSSSTFDGYQRKSSIDPDPKRFEIKDTYEENGHVAAFINYPNCTNYERNKILVFQHMTVAELKNYTEIDPHFSENGLSPFARFKPTKEGWESAKHLCQVL